jgi:hypothetical protein
MSTAAVIAIVVAVVVLLALTVLVLLPRMRRRRLELEQQRARLGREVAGHRQEAQARGSAAADAASEAEAHRRVAEDHVGKAKGLEDSAARAQRAAAFHEQRARESSAKLDEEAE